MSAINSTKAAFPGRRELVYARVAGAMYVLGDGMVDLGDMITSRIAGDSSFVDNAHRIAAAEGMYRFGTACHVFTTLTLIWLAVAFYVVLKPVDSRLALVALLFWVVETSVSAFINIFDFVSLRLSLSAAGTAASELPALGQLAGFADHMSGLAFNLGVIVFSMGSMVFYFLFLKSSYIPRAIAGFDLAASALVMLIGFTNLLHPAFSTFTGYGYIPMSIAEIGTGFWLMIVGIKATPNGNEPIVTSQ